MMSTGRADKPFEHDVLRYEALVDWRRRLRREEGFYRQLFEQSGVRAVLDAACGTGRHAERFHAWGLRVEGADISPAMIAHCRARYGESATLRWVARSFEQPADPPGAFDAVICVGNSLALAADMAAARRAVGAMLASIRSGGVCVIQVLNLWRLPEGPTSWQKCRRVTIAGRDHLLLKGIHRLGGRGYLDLADLELTSQGVTPKFDQTVLLGFESGELLSAIDQAGGREPRLYGTFAGEPYRRGRSPDLILVCRRA